jgi:hypothetical protein
MVRLVVLILLLLLLVVCMGVIFNTHVLASQSGLNSEVAEIIEIGLNCVPVAVCAILSALTARINKIVLFTGVLDILYLSNPMVCGRMSIFRRLCYGD